MSFAATQAAALTAVVVVCIVALHRSTRGMRVLPRMRCKACRAWLASVALVKNPAARGDGGPPKGWVIRLI